MNAKAVVGVWVIAGLTQMGLANAGHRVDPAVKQARVLARNAAPENLRGLKTMKRPGVKALAQLLRDGVIPEVWLTRLLQNEALGPHIEQVLVDLVTAQHLPNIMSSVKALAKQKTSIQGYAFEMRAQAVLGPALVDAGFYIRAHEIDGQLADGTVIEMKTGTGVSTQRKAIKQLQNSTQGFAPGLLITSEPLAESAWERDAEEPWEMQREFADNFEDRVAIVRVEGNRLVTQVPSRFVGFKHSLEKEARGPLPPRPASKRTAKRLAKKLGVPVAALRPRGSR